jgi:SAM-dependent methyltransferase
MSDIVIRADDLGVIPAGINSYMRLLNLGSNVLRSVRYAPAVLRAISRSKQPGTGPADWFSAVDDDTWFWMHTSTRIRRRPAIASLLPGLPPASMQENFTGSSGFSTLYQGFRAYQLFKNYYEKHVGPMRNSRGVLDFGCGWGRIIRFFLRDVAPEKLSGADHSEEAIRNCRATNKWCSFTLIEPNPPTPLASQSFDLIYLYSVFSHLPEEMHWALLREFQRLLSPGGMLIATTRRRDFIESCRALREDPTVNEKPFWLNAGAKVFLDTDATLSAYDNGEFCYGSVGAKDRWSFWGEACIPKVYVEKHWSDIFEICDYMDDKAVCPQNVIVARKRT